MAKESCCGGPVKIVLACCGACNVGQITNEVAKRLHNDGVAKFFCLAGVGGHVSGMVESAKGADLVLMLDGCPVGCGKKALDAAEVKGYVHMNIVSDVGVVKDHVFELKEADIDKTYAAAKAKLG